MTEEALNAVSGLDLWNVSSWEQIELWATANRGGVDALLLEPVVAATALWKCVYDALVEGIRTTRFLDDSAYTAWFIDKVFKAYGDQGWWNAPATLAVTMPEGRAPSGLDLMMWLDSHKEGVPWPDVPSSDYQRQKYGLLAAVDDRFPMALVKFYGAEARRLHAEDMPFVSWLGTRLAEKAAANRTYRPVLRAFEEERMRRQSSAMFVN